MNDLIKWAENQASTLLSPLDNRWLHVQGVAEKARHVSKAFNEDDATYLIAAAYLHDIGYDPLSSLEILFYDRKRRSFTISTHHYPSLFKICLRLCMPIMELA